MNKYFKGFLIVTVIAICTQFMHDSWAAWDPTLPADDEYRYLVPARIRANLEAIELGTDPDLQITNDKVSATAGIVDTKLAQITTANKVSGTAFTGLANIPVGAGVIPIANIPTIPNSNLAQITTADKVSGASFALLANIPSGAGVIPLANLSGITNAQIAATAGIVDTKLAQITTASKVSGAAITLLTSVPSGAGKLPVANIDTGTTANKIVQLNASAQLPAVDGSLLTGITAVTQANASVSGSAGLGYPYSLNIGSVAKTITAGKTVFIIATGYISKGGVVSIDELSLKYGATVIQTITIKVGNPNPDYNSKVPFTLSGIVTGLSGSTTFSVTSPYAEGCTGYANITVLEF